MFSRIGKKEQKDDSLLAPSSPSSDEGEAQPPVPSVIMRHPVSGDEPHSGLHEEGVQEDIARLGSHLVSLGSSIGGDEGFGSSSGQGAMTSIAATGDHPPGGDGIGHGSTGSNVRSGHGEALAGINVSLPKTLAVSAEDFDEQIEHIQTCTEMFAERFGFQKKDLTNPGGVGSNTENQAENLSTLLWNAEARHPGEGTAYLHKLVFSNYRHWLEHMKDESALISGVDNLWEMRTHESVAFTRTTYTSDKQAMRQDLVLWFMIWGEGGNLRLVPECLCFLFDVMAILFRFHSKPTESSDQIVYLDDIVRPLYRKLEAGFAETDPLRPKTHLERPNYDDLNEFFWRFKYLAPFYADLAQMNTKDGMRRNLDLVGLISQRDAVVAADNNKVAPQDAVAVQTAPPKGAMGKFKSFFRRQEAKFMDPVNQVKLNMKKPQPTVRTAEKTYVEKRTAFHVLLSMRPIFEFYIWTFYLMIVFAFYGTDIKPLTSTVMCVAAIELAICLGDLIILYGAWRNHLTVGMLYDTAIHTCALGVLVISYIYADDAVYYALAAIYVAYILIVRALHTVHIPYLNGLLQRWRLIDGRSAFLDKNFQRTPFSSKNQHSFFERIWYWLFWLVILGWKYFFDYYFLIEQEVEPTRNILASDNSETIPGIGQAWMLLAKWTPVFLFFLVDGFLWFYLLGMLISVAIGSFMKMGAVKEWDQIRGKFYGAFDRMKSKLMTFAVEEGTSLSVDMKTMKTLQKDNARALTEMIRKAAEQKNIAASEEERPSRDDPMHKWGALQWVRVAELWNAIIDDFRISDIISNLEKKYLELWVVPGENTAQVFLPLFLTAGALDDAISAADHMQENRRSWWYRLLVRSSLSEDISSYDDQHAAVTECLSLLIWINNTLNIGMKLKDVTFQDSRLGREDFPLGQVLRDLKKETQELAKSLKEALGKVKGMSSPVMFQAGTDWAKTVEPLVPGVRAKLAKVFTIVDTLVFNGFIILTDEDGSSSRERKTAADIVSDDMVMESATPADITPESLSNLLANKFAFKLIDHLEGLLTLRRTSVEPKNRECRNRIKFWFNSLFMEMPTVEDLDSIFSWTTMTPVYEEDIMTGIDTLKAEVEVGVSTLKYLQTVFPDEWDNFLERMGQKPGSDPYTSNLEQDLRLWASYRGQTVARTVRGMMQYENALRIYYAVRELRNYQSIAGQATVSLNVDEETMTTIRKKFLYLITCQRYHVWMTSKPGSKEMRKKLDADYLLNKYRSLRIAYIEDQPGGLHYSCLIKGSGEAGKDPELLYRVQLPGKPIIGEGKPENQNHAVIFSRGEMLQTIDMNQDNYLEEALKMPNFLEEMEDQQGSGKEPRRWHILGFREAIFTSVFSSVASFIASAEFTFGTLLQRMYFTPLCIRLHYGHPDIFDKIFAITRGGVSKASKSINLSEDIFAGFNTTLRGGRIKYREYMQVGKGRDTSFLQVWAFEAKLAGGAAEQTLSRDVARIGQNLDFARLFSFFYSCIGFYWSQTVTVYAAYTLVTALLVLSLLNLEVAIQGANALGAQYAIQLGLVLTLPYIVELIMERGLYRGLKVFLVTILVGSPVFFMFHMRTKCYYFARTLLFGGAKYRATGRGIDLSHQTFDEHWRFFAMSHFYFGVDMMFQLLVFAVFTENTAWTYALATWSCWLLSASIIYAPFYFNPYAFDMEKVTNDFNQFRKWIKREDGDAKSSWKAWWWEEHRFLEQLDGYTKLCSACLNFYWVMIAVTAVSQLDISLVSAANLGPYSFFIIVYSGSVILETFPSTLIPTSVAIRYGRAYGSLRWLSRIIWIGGSIAALIVCSDSGYTWKNFVRYGCAYIYLSAAITNIFTIYFPHLEILINIHKQSDYLIGCLLQLPIYILSLLQLPGRIQMALLLNDRFARTLSAAAIVKDATR